MDYGAIIERGTITAATDEGYEVASLDRVGIEAPPLRALDGAEYAPGDRVYFYLFHDGTGRIIGKF